MESFMDVLAAEYLYIDEVAFIGRYAVDGIGTGDVLPGPRHLSG